MDLLALRQNADRRFDIMMMDRQEYEPWWHELREQFAPNRGRFDAWEKPKKGLVRRNSRARRIPDDFAAGMKSGLTSPSRPWFSLTLYDDAEYKENEDIRAWLTSVQDIMQNQMIRTNLYDQLFDVYKEQGIFGTAALLIEEDDEDVFHAKALTIGSYCIGVDSKGRVNRFGRQFKRTLNQLAQEFGEEALPSQLRYALKDKPVGQYYELRNLIEPSDEFRMGDGPEGEFRWRSLWWLKGFTEPLFLRRKGYHEMPVMVPRWRIIGDDLYGREQPGDLGLDDAKTLQDLETDERSALKKGVRPPVAMPNSIKADVHDYPGGVTLYDLIDEKGVPAITKLYQVDFDHKSVAEKRLEVTSHLEETFHVNMFKMWTTDQKQGRTATEIEAREAEKMFMLGPLIERQMSELLDPMINRIYGIMSRQDLFPPPPEELEGVDLKVEYLSVLANIQKQASFAGIQTVMAITAELAKMQAEAGERPRVLDKLDADEIVEQLADMYVLPAGIVPGDDVVKERRKEREKKEAEAQRQQQLMAETEMAAKAAPQATRAIRDLSETQMPDGGTGLEAMAGMTAGPQNGTGGGMM